MILYELPRARDNSHIEDMDVSVIGISNDMTFYEELDPRAKDSLCEVEIHFPPYDADQLRSILNRRSEKAFVDSAVTQEAIALAAGACCPRSGIGTAGDSVSVQGPVSSPLLTTNRRSVRSMSVRPRTMLSR